MPACASSTPLSVGPSTRLALLGPASSDIAVLMRSGPTTSPIIMRRKGFSARGAEPEIIEALASSCDAIVTGFGV